MIELRLVLIETGFPDRTLAYRFGEEQIAMMKPVPRNPIAYALATDAEKANDPKQHIIRAAAMLGREIADFRDDRDGRNGERRAEIIANQLAAARSAPNPQTRGGAGTGDAG